jgi:hypothetical protein
MAEETLTANANDHHDDFLAGETTVPYALSVFSHHARGVKRICRRAWPVLSHGQIRVSTVGALRDLGYDVIRDGKKGHCLIPLDPPPWDWTPLRDIGFGLAQPNPEKIRRRREAK